MRRVGPLLLVSLAVAGCNDQEQGHVYVEVDRSQCSPACTISRYEVMLQRELADGGRCTFFSTSSTGSELIIPRLGLPAGTQIHVGLAAYCDSPPDSGADQPATPDLGTPDLGKPDLEPHPSPACCAAQAECLKDPGPQNEGCQIARDICPPEGRPDPSPGWVAYHNKYCTGPDAGPAPQPDAGAGSPTACVRCYALTAITLSPSRSVQAVLQLPSSCEVPELSPPQCP